MESNVDKKPSPHGRAEDSATFWPEMGESQNVLTEISNKVHELVAVGLLRVEVASSEVAGKRDLALFFRGVQQRVVEVRLFVFGSHLVDCHVQNVVLRKIKWLGAEQEGSFLL